MRSYKQQLHDRLIECGWERTELLGLGEWWAEDCWRIRSIQQCWGLELILSFLIDPSWEDARAKNPLVVEIIATSGVPETWVVPDPIATLSMVKGKFAPKLVEFVASLNRYRDEQ